MTGSVPLYPKPASVRPNYKIKPLDSIIVYSDMSPDETDVVPEKMDLNIVYEDADLMIINKPAGMVVHPGRRYNFSRP